MVFISSYDTDDSRANTISRIAPKCSNDKYHKNIIRIMQLIDYEKFYNDFDLDFFLTEPIGNFSRDDLKLILENFSNLKSITTLASIMGLRTMISNELLTLRSSREWKEKAHYLKQAEAVEIFCRLYLLDRLRKEYKVGE